MTLPNMKIWTGGDRGHRAYSKRVDRALIEKTGNAWMRGGWMANCGPEKWDDAHEYRLAPNGKLVPQDAYDDGWIAWSGGERPVDSETDVEIVTAKMPWKTNEDVAGRFHWEHGRHDQIIAYYIPSMVYETSQNLQQEHDMQETLTAAEALNIATGADELTNLEGVLEAWEEGGWVPVGDLVDLSGFIMDGHSIRRNPRTRRIEGEISEGAFLRLITLRDERLGASAMSALSEILNAVQDQ